ncbi:MULTISPECIES: C-terminal binding protein [Clostridium]|uniref:C-terminal binding protein n=1 Tax=Clostridium cibarium TaxID=2762247 RepID=A0ABR8PQN4_9CLOT|nr:MULTISPECIES: C-terminal binding protein [Clostridium]MBD7910488.1 C-terminal binding protein [Clostridium cibarium]
MKIVICDYEDVLIRDIEYEKNLIMNGLEGAEVIIYSYNSGKKEFIETIKDADGIITAFLEIDEEVLNRVEKLKCISINAVGYDNVDIKTASEKGIAVCAINEYCTQEVADHTLALILSLTRGIKHYTNDLDNKRIWQYQTISGLRRLEGQKLGIFGYGKIGKAVAKRALAFGMEVITFDPYVSKEDCESDGVQLVSAEYILEKSDIISNHMSQSNENKEFFNIETFKKMNKSPLFINVARGSSVNEDDLVKALDEGYISGAGLDVLGNENPELGQNKLLNRENVIITPHAAFYSDTSMKELQRISCENMINYLNGELKKVSKIIATN